MKRGASLFAIVMMLALVGWAQQPTNPAAGAAASAQTASGIPDGVIAAVEAKQNVDTNKAKAGDPVKLEVTEDGKDADGKMVKGPDGKPVLPRKTKLLARVSSVKPSTKESKEARLSLIVTTATFPNGKTVPFLGIVMGPFKVSGLSAGTGLDMQGRGSAMSGSARPDTSGPQIASGIEGVDIKPDPKLGTVLVAPRNFSLDNGTEFHVRYVDPSKHPAENENPPGK